MLTSLHHKSLQSGVCLVMHSDMHQHWPFIELAALTSFQSISYGNRGLKVGSFTLLMGVKQLFFFLGNTQKMGQDRTEEWQKQMRESVL